MITALLTGSPEPGREADVAGDPGVAGNVAHRVAQRLPIRRGRLAQRLEQQPERVVGQRRDVVRRVAVLLLVRTDELLRHGRRDVGGVVVGEIGAFDGALGQLDELRAAPGIRAHQRLVDALAACLLRDQADVVVVGRQEQHVRVGALDLGQLRGKVAVARRVGLEGDDAAAEFARTSCGTARPGSSVPRRRRHRALPRSSRRASP